MPGTAGPAEVGHPGQDRRGAPGADSVDLPDGLEPGPVEQDPPVVHVRRYRGQIRRYGPLRRPEAGLAAGRRAVVPGVPGTEQLQLQPGRVRRVALHGDAVAAVAVPVQADLAQDAQVADHRRSRLRQPGEGCGGEPLQHEGDGYDRGAAEVMVGQVRMGGRVELELARRALRTGGHRGTRSVRAQPDVRRTAPEQFPHDRVGDRRGGTVSPLAVDRLHRRPVGGRGPGEPRGPAAGVLDGDEHATGPARQRTGDGVVGRRDVQTTEVDDPVRVGRHRRVEVGRDTGGREPGHDLSGDPAAVVGDDQRTAP